MKKLAKIKAIGRLHPSSQMTNAKVDFIINLYTYVASRELSYF